MEKEAKAILAKMTVEEKERAALVGIMVGLHSIAKATNAIKKILKNNSTGQMK